MALKSLRKEFGVAVGAGESAIRIDTDEIDDALKTIQEVCKKHQWEMRVWDACVGTVWWHGKPPDKVAAATPPPTLKNPGDLLNSMGGANFQGPPNAVQALMEFLHEPGQPDKANKGEVRPVVLIVKNFHLAFEKERALVSAVVQHVVGDKVQDHRDYAAKLQKDLYEPNQIAGDSDTGKFLVGLMPGEAKLPAEVAPLFKLIEHELPDEAELSEILDGISPAEDNDDEDNAGGLSDSDRKKVCKYALGLTRLQAEGVFGASLVTHQKVVPSYVWQQKSYILNKEGLVSLYQGTEKFRDVVGSKGLKDLLKDLLKADEWEPDNPKLRSKGLALVGPPRTGKTLTAKAAGNELGLPTLMIDVGALFGGFVGDTERNTRRMFQVVRAHAPCIAVIDEVEKVMPAAKGNDGSGGVGKRMAGTFMTQLQDIQEHVFWVFTANGVEELHEAFLADDRVDGVVYVHMPGPDQLAAGWKMYLKESFPAEIGGETYPGYVETDLPGLLKELKAAKKVNPSEWAKRLLPAVMCVTRGDDRVAALKKVGAVDDNVAQTLTGLVIDDSTWTLARVKAVCRLSRKRGRSISEISKMMPRAQRKLERAIARLEAWAEDEAIDAETGLAYVPPEPPEIENDEVEDDDEGGRTKASSKGKMRRKIRRLDKD